MKNSFEKQTTTLQEVDDRHIFKSDAVEQTSFEAQYPALCWVGMPDFHAQVYDLIFTQLAILSHQPQLSVKTVVSDMKQTMFVSDLSVSISGLQFIVDRCLRHMHSVPMRASEIAELYRKLLLDSCKSSGIQITAKERKSLSQLLGVSSKHSIRNGYRRLNKMTVKAALQHWADVIDQQAYRYN